MFRNKDGYGIESFPVKFRPIEFPEIEDHTQSFFDLLLQYSSIGAEQGCENVGYIIISHKDFSIRFTIDPQNPYEWKVTVKSNERKKG